MEFDRHHPRRDGGGGGPSNYASSTSGVRYPSIPPDAGLRYYGTGALISSSEHDQVQQFLYNADSAIPGHGPPRDPVAAPFYCKDRELEIRRCCLREIADRIELAHFRMLEEHDRRAFAIAEQAPYSRQIPFYPELLPDNSQINHTAEQILHSRSPQRVVPMYDHLPVERHLVQRDLTLETQWGPRVTVDVPSIEPVVMNCPVVPLPVQVPIIKKKLRTSADINRKRKKEYGCDVIKIQPTMQSKWSCARCTVEFASEEAMDVHFQEKHHICESNDQSKSEKVENNKSEEGRTGVNAVGDGDQDKKVGPAADTNKKLKKEHGHQMIDVKPTMEGSKWACGWCSANFDSKEAMDAHLQEQHQSSIGNGPSESEEVENNSTEARTSLTVVTQGDQKKAYQGSSPQNKEIAGSSTNKKIKLGLPPSTMQNPENKNISKKGKLHLAPLSLKQKCDEPSKEEVLPIPENTKLIPDDLHKGEILPTSEDEEIAGLNTNNKIPLELPPSFLKNRNDKAYQGSTPQNKEIAGSSTNKKIKFNLPPSTMQNPENKNISKKGKLHLPPSSLKQKRDEPSKEEVLPIPENTKQIPDELHKGEVVPISEDEEIAGLNTNNKIPLELPPSSLKNRNDKAYQGSSPQNKEIVGSSTNKKIKFDLPPSTMQNPENKNISKKGKLHLPPSSLKQKCDEPSKEEVLPIPENTKQITDELHKGEVVPISEDEEIAGLNTNNKIPLELPPSSLKNRNDKAYQGSSPQNKEIAGSSTNKKIKFDLPSSTMQNPENKNISKKGKRHLPPSSLKQNRDEPSKEEVLPIPENKKKPDTDTTETGCIVSEERWFCDLCKVNKLTRRALDDHLQSDAHLDKLSTLLRSKKYDLANKTVSENPVQEVSQAVSLPMLKELKEETSKSMPVSQLDMASQKKGNQSLSNGTVISTGHKEILNPKANLFNKKKGLPLNGITQPILVSKDGKWFCNLCDAKWMTEKVKEAHLNGKRHWLNVQAAGFHWCFLCHIRCTSEVTLREHYNGKRHRQALMDMNVAQPGGAFNP